MVYLLSGLWRSVSRKYLFEKELTWMNELLERYATDVNIYLFLFNMLLCSALSLVLGSVYIRFGKALSNRRNFARNFMLISMTTMLVITVVKSSIALSLGLVGALSIVRFRAAIKEPEELSYLFLAIATGLGLGTGEARLTVITVVGFTLMISAVILRAVVIGKSAEDTGVFLSVSCEKSSAFSLDSIVDILDEFCSEVSIKRLDEKEESFEVMFVLEYESFEKLNLSLEKIRQWNNKAGIALISNAGSY